MAPLDAGGVVDAVCRFSTRCQFRAEQEGSGTVAAPDGQVGVLLSAVAMTPEIERFLATQPKGMVRPELWLRPAP